MNFGHFPEMHARSYPQAPAVADPRLRLNYGELDRAANRFANLLTHSGVKDGDRVAFILPNRVELAIGFLGTLKAGSIAVPINWRLKAAELDAVLTHCQPSLLVTKSALTPKIPSSLVSRTLMIEEGRCEGSFWSRLNDASPEFASLGRQSVDISNLLYTSGTTGTPKAAIHTHGMRAAIAATMVDRFEMSANDVGIGVSPMFHTGGLSVFTNAVYAGASVFLMEKWDLQEFVATIKREKTTYTHLVTTIVVDLVRAAPDMFEYRDQTMRFTWGGGHSADSGLFKEYERRLGGVFLQGYSRTEGGIAYNRLTDRRFDMHGYPSRNNSELAILRLQTDEQVARGETGEIAFRGDGVSPGYWDPARPELPTARYAWQRTGDVGYVREDGALVFVGRLDDMIKTGGENVFPAEIAAVILSMPGVSDVAVFSMPDERLGQCVSALVVSKDDELSTEKVEAHCRTSLAGFKIPRRIGIVGSLPRLGTHKVDIGACRRLIQNQ